MDWKSVLTALGTSIGGTSAVLAVAALLARRWIGTRIEESVKHEYAVKLEGHKAHLQEQVARATQELQSQYAAAAEGQAADKVLFQQFLETLPSTGSVAFLRDANVTSGPFRRDELSQLDEFYQVWQDAEHQFLDVELDGSCASLRSAIGTFRAAVATNVFSTDTPGTLSMAQEWKTFQPDVYLAAQRRLDALADAVLTEHQKFIALARRRLKC